MLSTKKRGENFGKYQSQSWGGKTSIYSTSIQHSKRLVKGFKRELSVKVLRRKRKKILSALIFKAGSGGRRVLSAETGQGRRRAQDGGKKNDVRRSIQKKS